MLNGLLLLVGLPSLVLAFWTLYGLATRGRRPEAPPRKGRLLGVAADYAHVVGMPVWLVRSFLVFYGLMGVGFIFYGLYYLVMRTRPAPILEPPEASPPPTITKIESHYR